MEVTTLLFCISYFTSSVCYNVQTFVFVTEISVSGVLKDFGTMQKQKFVICF